MASNCNNILEVFNNKVKKQNTNFEKMNKVAAIRFLLSLHMKIHLLLINPYYIHAPYV